MVSLCDIVKGWLASQGHDKTLNRGIILDTITVKVSDFACLDFTQSSHFSDLDPVQGHNGVK